MGCCTAKDTRKPQEKQPGKPPAQRPAPKPLKPPKLPETQEKAEVSFHEDLPKPSPPIPNAMQPVLIPENTERLKHFYDVQQPPSRVKMYDIAKEVQMLSLEKASPRDWQLTLSRSLNLSSAGGVLHMTPAALANLTVHSQWDHRLLVETAGRVLSLPPRDWIQEQLVLYKEQFRPGSDMATTARRKTLQLNEHFKWLAWAAAAYFVVTISGNDPEREFATLFFQPSDASFASHPNSSTASNLQSGMGLDLPTTQEAWLQGFSFKGVYMRLALETTKEADIAKAEALGIERLGQVYQAAQDALSFSLLFPMTSQVTFGPYILHSTPVIPGNFMGKSSVPTLEIPFPSRPSFILPKENLLQLFKPSSSSVSDRSAASSTPISIKPLYMVVNLHSMLHPARPPRYLLFLSSLGSEIRVMKLMDKDPAIPSRATTMLQEEGKEMDLARLRMKTVDRFGWVFDMYGDAGETSLRPNRVASLLIPGSVGEFLVNARVKSTPGKHLFAHKDGKETRRQSVQKVVSLLETTDSISNHSSFLELLKRQRLSSRHSWLILSRLKDEKSRILVQTELVSRAVRQYLHSVYAEKGLRSFLDYRDLLAEIVSEVLFVENPPKDEIMLCLFLSRLKVFRDFGKNPSGIQSPDGKNPSFDVLLEHEFVRNVYKSASKSPGLFLSVRN